MNTNISPQECRIQLIKRSAASSPSSTATTELEIATFYKQDDRKLGASSFHGSYESISLYESEVFCNELERVYLSFVLRKVEEIIKDQQKKALK